MTDQWFETKGTGEKWPLVFDFSQDLQGGELLSGVPVVTVTVRNGTDPSPQNILASGTMIDGTSTKVIVPVQAGVANTDYDVLVRCPTTNTYKTLELNGILPVRQL
jgi:hypothetical protein